MSSGFSGKRTLYLDTPKLWFCYIIALKLKVKIESKMDSDMEIERVSLSSVDQIQCKFAIGEDQDFGGGWDFTNAFKLASEKKSLEPLRVGRNNLLLLYHLYTKREQYDDGAGGKMFVFSKGGRGAGTTSYERMMTCWDPFGAEGSNIVVLFIGRGQNPNLFDKFLNERDTGGFSECNVCFIVQVCVCMWLISFLFAFFMFRSWKNVCFGESTDGRKVDR